MGSRAPGEVVEKIGSLELAWLISEVEQRYGRRLDLDDDTLSQMTTVSGAVAAIGQMLAGGEDG
jgi:acyl carrier protein